MKRLAVACLRIILLAALPLGALGCASGDVDPGIQWARDLRPVVQDKLILQQQRASRENARTQFALQLNAAEEKKIPYSGLLSYPADWPDIVRSRQAAPRSY